MFDKDQKGNLVQHLGLNLPKLDIESSIKFLKVKCTSESNLYMLLSKIIFILRERVWGEGLAWPTQNL